MRFTNSIRLVFENFRQVYKLFVCKAISILVYVALCSVFILPGLSGILQHETTTALGMNIQNIFLAFMDPALNRPSEYVQQLIGEGGTLELFVKYILSLRLEIILVCVACVLTYLIKCFADEIVHFTIGSSLKDRMDTYMEPRFMPVFVANLGKASAYAGIHVPASFAFDVLSVLAFTLSLRFLPILVGLFVGMTLLIVIQTFKMILTGHWLPAMTAGEKTVKELFARKEKQEKIQFGKLFVLYMVTFYIVIIVNVVAAVCTFGSALLITVPASYFLFICEQYVAYYTINGKKYFITYESIATNPSRGDREHFFDYIDETAPTTEMVDPMKDEKENK